MAAAASVDFQGNPSGAAGEINEWASDETRGHITNVVDPAGLRRARLILANAIYFNGMWKEQFEKHLTPIRISLYLRKQDAGQVDASTWRILLHREQ